MSFLNKMSCNFSLPDNESVYCDTKDEVFLCWPPTKAGENYTQNCPSLQGFNSSRIVYKYCNEEGIWDGGPQIALCIDDNLSIKQGIVKSTRYLELIGYSMSLLTLVISLAIFFNFRVLRNNRTRIHRNLFLATLIHVLMRLVLYWDQEMMHGIDSTPYLCEACYTLLEYARTAMFMWMFAEGLYLHNVITVTVFQEHAHYVLYGCLGWVFPALMTLAWTIVMAMFDDKKCWSDYNFVPYYWILEGPRVLLMFVNLVFLLIIISVLVSKLRQNHASDIEQVRKSVRAALLLLPLLGVPNLLQMVINPIEWGKWEYALWSYTTHFLASFQGFFISLIYCFMNGEVRSAIKSRYNLSADFRTVYSAVQKDSSSVRHSIDTNINGDHHHKKELKMVV